MIQAKGIILAMGLSSYKEPAKCFMMLLFLKFFYRHWENKIAHKFFHKSILIPWMTYREAAIIEEVLRKLKPKKCLEWGAGYSTLVLSSFIRRSASWIAIEHDTAWAEKIKSINRRSKVAVYSVPPNHFPWTDEHGDGNFSDLKDYIEFPARFAPFDFILLDGRARRECLAKAHAIISKEGLVILHDAQREYYHPLFKLYKYQLLLRDYAGRIIWMGSKEIDVNKMLDFNKFCVNLDKAFNKLKKFTEIDYSQ